MWKKFLEFKKMKETLDQRERKCRVLVWPNLSQKTRQVNKERERIRGVVWFVKKCFHMKGEREKDKKKKGFASQLGSRAHGVRAEKLKTGDKTSRVTPTDINCSNQERRDDTPTCSPLTPLISLFYYPFPSLQSSHPPPQIPIITHKISVTQAPLQILHHQWKLTCHWKDQPWYKLSGLPDL